MGVRMALGARAADVVQLVVGHGVRVAALGILGGAAIAIGAARRVAPLLFETRPTDPLVLGGVARAWKEAR